MLFVLYFDCNRHAFAVLHNDAVMQIIKNNLLLLQLTTTTTITTTTTTTTKFGTNSDFENSKNHLRIRLVN